MLERKEYFISIDNKMIEDTKLPGQAELKISATDDEIEIIKNYMINKENNLEETEEETEEEVKQSPNDNASASYTPTVGDNEGYDSDFEKLIDLVYKLGTDETKQELEQYR